MILKHLCRDIQLHVSYNYVLLHVYTRKCIAGGMRCIYFAQSCVCVWSLSHTCTSNNFAGTEFSKFFKIANCAKIRPAKLIIVTLRYIIVVGALLLEYAQLPSWPNVSGSLHP